jgi:3-methyladenine DNA glycosylase AlkD
MNSHDLYQNISEYCIANRGDEASVKKYSRFFKEGYDGYGLSAPLMYAKSKELLKLPDISMETVLEALPLIFKNGRYEEISIALLVLDGFSKQYTKGTLRKVESFYKMGITNWAHADTLGMFILPKFIKRNVIRYSEMKPWLNAENKFQRRSVPVTLIKLLKTTDDFEPLFYFIEPLVMDPEREVHQGVGWFLREAWKLKHNETELFLMKWKDKAPRLIIQYATEKMTPNEKLRFRRSK